jgi:peptidyl-tRNA hydrolase
MNQSRGSLTTPTPPETNKGIGRPTGSMDVASYVLQDFRQSEMADIDNAIAGARVFC